MKDENQLLGGGFSFESTNKSDIMKIIQKLKSMPVIQMDRLLAKIRREKILEQEELGQGTYYCCYLCRKLVEEFDWVEGFGNIANTGTGTKDVMCRVCELCIKRYNALDTSMKDEELSNAARILNLQIYYPVENK